MQSAAPKTQGTLCGPCIPTSQLLIDNSKREDLLSPGYSFVLYMNTALNKHIGLVGYSCSLKCFLFLFVYC